MTLKPAVYVANCADELLPEGGEPAGKVKRLATSESAPGIVLSARLEARTTPLVASTRPRLSFLLSEPMRNWQSKLVPRLSKRFTRSSSVLGIRSGVESV